MGELSDLVKQQVPTLHINRAIHYAVIFLQSETKSLKETLSKPSLSMVEHKLLSQRLSELEKDLVLYQDYNDRN